MIHHGDLFGVLPMLEADHFDAGVTDPPYGIGFMGKEWDSFKPRALRANDGRRFNQVDRVKLAKNPNLRGRKRSPAMSPSQIEYDRTLIGQRGFQEWTERWAREVFRVLKPGAHMVVCGAPRSYHRMASGLEDAGFEIRDTLAWIFGQGFPKSKNLGDGIGTALKPAYEPIALVRKPFRGSVTKVHSELGTGGLDIDACRIPSGPDHAEKCASVVGLESSRTGNVYGEWHGEREDSYNPLGRWPANAILDAVVGQMLDIGAEASAARFFYCPKPSRDERDFGCDALPQSTGGHATKRKDGSAGLNSPRAGAGRTGGARNIHPTVKPLELMRWLVRLITPPDGIVLDPFLGSGTTGMACRAENRMFVGIEREAEYVTIAERRIAAVAPLFASAQSEAS